MDIMFINKISFLITISRNIKFGTIDVLDNRQVRTVVQKIRSVIRLYKHRGFEINTILADHEFEPLRPFITYIDTTAEGKHQPDVEGYIGTVKDRSRSAYNMLPF